MHTMQGLIARVTRNGAQALRFETRKFLMYDLPPLTQCSIQTRKEGLRHRRKGEEGSGTCAQLVRSLLHPMVVVCPAPSAQLLLLHLPTASCCSEKSQGLLGSQS